MNMVRALLFSLCSIAALMSPTHSRAAEPLPQLIVTDVKVVPEHPFAGDAVKLVAVVKNVGTAPTPEGVVLGGIFKLNGSVIAYEDQYKHTLAPGESVTLISSGGGGAGNGTWLAKAGKYTLGFLVDDVGRIKVVSKAGSEMTALLPLRVIAFDGPDLVLRRFAWAAKPDGTVLFSATVANIGNVATPEKVPLGVEFRLDGARVSDARTPDRLKPGQSVQMTGKAVSVAPGKHIVKARTSALGRMMERRTDNNSLTSQFWQDQTLSETAQPAEAFADSVGVCIHLGYSDTAYSHYDVIKRRLIQSGIRYVRDGVAAGNANVIGKLKDLGASGIKTDLLVDPRRVTPAQAVTLVKTLGPSVVSVEGPNEPNQFYSELFPDGVRDYQARLYAALKADPETASVPVLSPALAFPGEIAARLGPVACDFGAMHPYPGGQLPDAGLDETLKATLIVAPGKGVITTETGYDTAIHVTSGQPAVSEAAEAKYMPRLLLEALARGVKRSYIYEFSDEKPEPAMHDAEQHFGLVRIDGTPKPALMALANMIHLLADPGPAFKAHALGFRLSGDVSDLRHAVFQKRDGRLYLVFWVNGYSYNQDAQADADVPSRHVAVTLDRPALRALLYRPALSSRPIGGYGQVRTLTLDVPDEPLVVELTPTK